MWPAAVNACAGCGAKLVDPLHWREVCSEPCRRLVNSRAQTVMDVRQPHFDEFARAGRQRLVQPDSHIYAYSL